MNIYVNLSGKNCYWLKKNAINAKRIFNKRKQIGRQASCNNQRNFVFRTCVTICSSKPDQVSIMQKTGWTNYSSFLVWSGVEMGFPYGCDFRHGDTQPTSRVILEQVCPWPVRWQSFAIFNLNYFFTVFCPIRHPVILNKMVELWYRRRSPLVSDHDCGVDWAGEGDIV